MNIAIQGHPTRGKEVIQILESLGGKNTHELCGNGKDPVYHYHIDSCGIIAFSSKYSLHNCKLYTLEEFEKEFPFKIGDLCIYHSDILNTDIVVKILGMAIENDCIVYEVGHKDTTTAYSGIYKGRHTLKPYKEMKEERNITLTLDKAKEWYNKGGELKEVALQAYSEEELSKVDLPKTWEEFCDNYRISDSEAYFDSCCIVHSADITYRNSSYDKNICPSKKSAEAHLAMIQLEQLRDCYRGLFVTVIGMPVWGIVRYKGKLIISRRTWGTNETFLSFQSLEIAEKYLNNFEPLIKQAGDLI